MDKPGLAQSLAGRNCLDEEDKLSNYDLIFLSASPGIGKTHHLNQSQILRFSHRLTFILSSIHNDENNFWSELFDLCVATGWIKSGLLFSDSNKEIDKNSMLDLIRICIRELNKYSNNYSKKDNIYLIFDNIHLIKNTELQQQIVYFVQQLNSSIKCVFSGRDQYFYDVLQDSTAKKSISFNDECFLLDQLSFTQIMCSLAENTFNKLSESTLKIIDAVYELVGGHIGLGIRCIDTSYVKYVVETEAYDNVENFAFQLVQTEEIHQYCYQLTRELSSHELDIISLPLLNRSLVSYLNQGFKKNKNLNYYRERGLFKSTDQVDFYQKSLFRYWLSLNIKAENESLLIMAIEQYRKYDHWQEAIECAITLEDWPLAIDLICQAARYFSRRGQYDQARMLIDKLPRAEKQQPLILSLFENLLDFQQYGHQVAGSNLNLLVSEHRSYLKSHRVDKESEELIALLQHHYSFLIKPNQKIDSPLGIQQHKSLFNRDNELCAWAWHSLAMEQVLASEHVAGLNSLIKAIYWSLEKGDAPCALASLAWIVVPCLQQGKLSIALEYCNKVEHWLKKNQLMNFAMVSTVYRVRIIIYREQGNLRAAEQELILMKDFYPSLDPLNLAYCYWAEFILLLAQKNLVMARKQLFIIEGHVAVHFDTWQLALPKPELLSAVLDTLAGSELAMLNWASQFQLQHVDNNDVWLKATHITLQSEVIAYLRVRITLGSDMTQECNQLIEQAELKQDRLLALHCIILSLLNANRQGDDAKVHYYRHQLLNRAGILEFYQVYKEYLDELLPLLLNYQPLPSELTGYEKIVPKPKIASADTEADVKQADIYNSEIFLILTTREKQIALLVLEGFSNNEISVNLTIGLATVKGHVSNIYNKLGIKRRAQLANLLSTSN